MIQKPIPLFLKKVYYNLFIITTKGNQVECPICNLQLRRFINVSKSRATPSGNFCPRCRSLERHRLLWLFLKQRTEFFYSVKKTVLHIAPEPCFKNRFERLDNLTYIISDFNSRDPQHHIDITNILLPDKSVDVILCNHVLEHIPDDRKAIQELHRILKGDGWAIINVPVDYNRSKTYEDISIISRLERIKHFGQEDHVRVYGRDYPDRLKAGGFMADEIDYTKELGGEISKKHALLADEFIYFCHKSATA